MLFKFSLPSREEIRNSPNGKKMLRFIEDESDCFAKVINGCPGSGKTTISIYRLIYLSKKGSEAFLLTYQKMLTHAIKNLISQKINDASSEHISTFHKWYYEKTNEFFPDDDDTSDEDIYNKLHKTFSKKNELSSVELIIDEAQDLPEKVFTSLPRLFKKITIGADNAQKIHAKGANEEDILSALKKIDKGNTRTTELFYNYRNTYEIYNFARQFVPNNPKANDETVLRRLEDRNRSDLPVIYIVYSDQTKLDRLKILLTNANGNIAVLLPQTKQVDYYHSMITKLGIDCSKYHSGLGDVPKQLERILVTTYKSAKGLEFDAVILPYIDSPKIKKFDVVKRECYVASTRARRNLFIICFNKLEEVFLAFDKNTYELRDLKSK